ncbi:MAG TPA: hypothetical protein PLP17_14045, partial [Oligoflexia bacterium]|nr:hypothetical protein [Oligoflexia bacterium]
TAGLVFTYDPVDPASNVLTLMRFDSPTAKPLIVDMTVIRELTPKEKKAGMVIDPTHVIDRSPPVSGSAYYAMTGTWGRYNENTATKAGLSRSVIAPWWGAGTAPSAEGDTRGAYLTYWLSQQSVIYTSEYSLPVVYIADPLPQLEAINSIAVDPKTDEVYVNEPPAARISKITKKFGQLDEQLFFANTNFPSPGAQGLAISSGPVLYADNSASDAQFGGRIFSWNAKGQREFRGTMNYFSQILMFANPVSVGPLAMAPDGGLYAFERLGRDVRRVPVNATYDPNRRTGQFVVRIPDDGRGTLIDLEVQTAQAKQGVIYMLDGRGVSALQLPTKKLPLASVGRFKLQ